MLAIFTLILLLGSQEAKHSRLSFYSRSFMTDARHREQPEPEEQAASPTRISGSWALYKIQDLMAG